MNRIEQINKELSKIEKELDKIGIATPLTHGFGTQRLGHAQKKREGLAQRQFKLRSELYELENKE